MPYLAPPPEPAPVVVVRDIGGEFSRYRRQTSMYRARNRQVQLQECRSACTLALSLPRVCVLPSSVLRFNQIYDRRAKKVDVAATDEMFRSYPQAVRSRLGYLTRKYKTLSGSELIALGIRNCATDETLREQVVADGAAAVRQPAYVPPGHGPVARFLSRTKSRMAGWLPNEIPGRKMFSADAPRRITASISRKVSNMFSGRWFGVKVDRAPVASIPAAVPAGPAGQPALSAAITPGLVDVQSDEPQTLNAAKLAPLPPPRPIIGVKQRTNIAGLPIVQGTGSLSRNPELPQIITGAYPVLPPTFRAYAPLR